MSTTLDIGKIVAELSGTAAEQAKSLIAQQTALGSDLTEWQLLLDQVNVSVQQDIAVQNRRGDAPNALLVFTLQMSSCGMVTSCCCCCILA